MTSLNRNFGCRVHANFKINNLDNVVLENEKLRVSVLAGRGADVIECLYKPKDLDLVWLTRHGLPDGDPGYNYLDALGAFVDYYPGGWQTVFPNAGAPVNLVGAQFSQHAEVSLLPWKVEILEDTIERVTIKLSCRTRKTPFSVSRIMTLNQNSALLEITEIITNESNVEIPTMWGTHFSFGSPFLYPGDKIKIAGTPKVICHPTGVGGDRRRIENIKDFTWPTHDGIDFSVIPEKDTPSDMLYITELEMGEYVIDSHKNQVSIKVNWDKDLMPYLWYWQEFGRSKTYPWYGENFNIGLEPFSSYPTNGLIEAIENKSALIFKAKETKTSLMTYQISEL